MATVKRNAVGAGRCLGWASVMAALVAVTAPAVARGQSDQTAATTGKRLIVMPRAGLPEDQLQRIVGAHGAKAKRAGQSRIYIVELPANASDRAIAALLANNPHLEFAEPDALVPPNTATNDPYFGSAWHLAKVGVPTVWGTSTGSGVPIAILDTGVFAAHPDLSAKLLPGWNYYDNNSDTNDYNGHGTRTTGTAGAIGNNGIGVVGTSIGSPLIHYRISDPAGYGSGAAVVSALTAAADRGIRVASLSFNFTQWESVKAAAQYFKDKGGLLFMSAGNTSAEDTSAPSSSWIVVSATDQNDARPSWSTWGSFVSLAAPGVSIWTTNTSGGYETRSGTSHSAPIAAGVASLIFNARPDLTSSQVEKILFDTAVDLGPAGRDPYFGFGRIDATAALNAALAYKAPTDTSAPSVSVASPRANVTVAGITPVDVSASDNVGVSKVELLVNGTLLATDTTAPYAFSWDTTRVADGIATLSAVAYDAAGNVARSTAVQVNVSNAARVTDTTPPVVAFVSPTPGSSLGTSATVTTSASDNAGAAGITQSLIIGGKVVASSTGSKLSYKWNTRKLAKGTYTLQVTARDQAGNTSSSSISVQK